MGLPWGSVGKESACNAGNLGSVPGSLSNRMIPYLLIKYLW